uniref:Uncharacterized protein n=1 Tax=Lepeophtheirus salmonis TaxID=72036 RepID=A0A0K2T6S6_LEPSM
MIIFQAVKIITNIKGNSYFIRSSIVSANRSR